MDKGEEVALRYTHRAEELRCIAEGTRDPEARAAMLSLADSYDLMAERAIAATWSKKSA